MLTVSYKITEKDALNNCLKHLFYYLKNNFFIPDLWFFVVLLILPAKKFYKKDLPLLKPLL